MCGTRLKGMKREIIIVPKDRYVSQISQKMGMLPFPDHDGLPFSENSSFVRYSRLKVLFRVMKDENIGVVTTLLALARYTISKENLKSGTFKLKVGDSFSLTPEDFLRLGYTRVDIVRDYGEFAIRGDIIDFFSPWGDFPIRIELFDDRIEDVRIFDPTTQRSVENLEYAVLIPAREYLDLDHRYDTVVGETGSEEIALDYFENFEFKIWDLEGVLRETRKKMRELLDLAGEKADEYRKASFESIENVVRRLKKYEEIRLDLKTFEMEKLEKKEKEDEIPIVDLDEVKPGDVVVHKDYGIGRFEGMVSLENVYGRKDYLKIKYEDSILYVPVERMSRVHKYIGTENVKLDSLSARRWKGRLRKIRDEIEKKIRDLVKLYAERSSAGGLSLQGDSKLEWEFAERFPFVETRDQIKAIEEVLSDLADDKPMDRLVCGDSGYGKTEVAMRAAFRAVVSGKQVALIAPTVVLANQHYRTFKERMGEFGIVVELLDGTRTAGEKRKVLEGLKKGSVDIVIGTHALLSDKVRFADLGLVIIDEEHKFGVLQKEKLKKLRVSVNVLSMSATPIPRTLQMALSGMRDISVINTPPVGRRPVIVHVVEYSDALIKSAVLREMARGGQVLYVHNRIEELRDVEKKLRKILPDVSVGIAHGRMNKKKLERIVESFYSGKLDLLLCTTIVESGLDIPTANTIIVDDSHRYGLAQLYQLRGRVGRRNTKGYAYFLYPRGVSKNVLRRLEILKKHIGPGSGMEIALRDLEMRGYGDLLGIDQHGYVESIGYKYYIEILKETVGRITGAEVKTDIDVEIEGFPGSVLIPEGYISDPMERMRVYRRLSSAKELEEVEEIEDYLKDVFGPPPVSVVNLMRLAKLRIKLGRMGIEKIKFEDGSMVVKYRGEKPRLFEEHTVLENDLKKTLIVYDVRLEDLEKELKLVK